MHPLNPIRNASLNHALANRGNVPAANVLQAYGYHPVGKTEVRDNGVHIRTWRKEA